MIYIVESDPVLLRTYAEALADDSRQIVTFRTAGLAVKALDRVIPDILLLELALPGHNGFELLYELRSYADTRTIKVVINSLVKEEDIDWSYVSKQDFGIVKYLYKPHSSIEQLVSATLEFAYAD